MRATIREIVAHCDALHLSSIDAVRDYFAEKDSHITRLEALSFVIRAREELAINVATAYATLANGWCPGMIEEHEEHNREETA